MDGLTEDHLTVTEAANELGVNVATVRHRLSVGLLQGVKIAPRLWLIPREEVERAKVAGRLKPGPKPKDQRAPEVDAVLDAAESSDPDSCAPSKRTSGQQPKTGQE